MIIQFHFGNADHSDMNKAFTYESSIQEFWLSKQDCLPQNVVHPLLKFESLFRRVNGGAEWGVYDRPNSKCFVPFHQHSMKSETKGYAMVIKHITSGKAEKIWLVLRIPGFKVHDKADLRYERRYYLGGCFHQNAPPSPNLSTFFYYVSFIFMYDEAGVGWFWG